MRKVVWAQGPVRAVQVRWPRSLVALQLDRSQALATLRPLISRHLQLVLISGHLVQFHITGRTSLHHRKDRVLDLLDAYVCSGYLAAQHLPEGQYDANAAPVARRYQDGLETDDGEEDTLFVLWYRKVRGGAAGVRRNNSGADVPPLGAKRKVAVFRTRSKLERDVWVCAINVEIEKVVRASREREEAVRQAGQLLRT